MPVIDTVVFPVAGRGTRLLPLTKSVPKELLPVYDKPILQFAIEEAISTGATRLVFVTHASKAAIGEYLASDDSLINVLKNDGKEELAQALSNVTLSHEVEVVFVEQAEPLGLGHAVLMAEDHVRGDAFGVILPDDVILGQSCLPELASAYVGGHMIAAMEVPVKDVKKYGIIRPIADGTVGQAIRASELIEKPAPDDTPSQLAAAGRYILDPRIFDALRTLKPGAGGEYQLTDAITATANDMPLTAYRFSGSRYDCGSHEGLLSAANARAEEHACTALVAE
jgi:UTP--glucose-1-phosphate uridylyltransferase